MDNLDFEDLLKRYNTGTCSAEEKALIEAWYLHLELRETTTFSDAAIDSIAAMEIPVPNQRKESRIWKWTAVAAAILMMITTSVYFITRTKTPSLQYTVNDVNPLKRDRAILTLSDGKKIVLENTSIGLVTNQSGIKINKTVNNAITYQNDGIKKIPEEIAYNTMSTPKGGQYHLTLADGTRVWLNAATSITYPTYFKAHDRQVEVTGEAYFEVAHLNGRPFRVVSKGQIIEVLGTHFNLNAYPEEPETKTTLLEGAVKVSTQGKSILLTPGQQAQTVGNELNKKEADIEQVMAWHYGDLMFNGQSIAEIMRTIARWYDVEIVYVNQPQSRQTFSGVVSRTKNLSAIINMMNKGTSLKFEIIGKKVIVSDQHPPEK